MSGSIAATGRRGGEGAKDATGGPGAGVTDHGALTGLLDDDHPQYASKDLRATFLASAAARLSSVPANQIAFDCHMYSHRGTNTIGSSASGAGALSTWVEGAIKLAKGTTAGGSYITTHAAALSGLQPHSVPGGATGKWWLGAYFRSDQAAAGDGGAAVVGYGQAGVPEYWLGYRGAYHASNWIFWGRTGGALASALAVDAGVYHYFEAWRDGATTFLAIDEGAPVSAAGVYPTTSCNWGMMVFDTAVTDRSLAVVGVALARQRP